jgi:hypothetical protein
VHVPAIDPQPDRRRPLSRFAVLATGDLEEARDAVTRVYLPHELVNADKHDDRLGMVLNAVEDRNFTLGYLTYGAATRLTMPATENCYHVNLTRPATPSPIVRTAPEPAPLPGRAGSSCDPISSTGSGGRRTPSSSSSRSHARRSRAI